jgi:methylphosphotriester-DNA--protein-cysteine methyltransferase
MQDGLVTALASRFELPWEPASAPIARQAARIFERENATVESVAARVGVTARHLRRAFAENIGVTPKEFARAARLRRALEQSSRSHSNWLRIAIDTGYYDHAHLVADFRDLLGLTPTAFAIRAREQSSKMVTPKPAVALG